MEEEYRQCQNENDKLDARVAGLEEDLEETLAKVILTLCLAKSWQYHFSTVLIINFTKFLNILKFLIILFLTNFG